MACIFCNRPMINTNPYCLDCEWAHIIRMQTFDEIIHYIEEEDNLKKQLAEVRKRKKAAQKRYDEMWDKIEAEGWF